MPIRVSQTRLGTPPSSCIQRDEIQWSTSCQHCTIPSSHGRRLGFLKRVRRLCPNAHTGSDCQPRSYCFFCKQARRVIDMKSIFQLCAYISAENKGQIVDKQNSNESQKIFKSYKTRQKISNIRLPSSRHVFLLISSI